MHGIQMLDRHDMRDYRSLALVVQSIFFGRVRMNLPRFEERMELCAILPALNHSD